MHRSTVRVWFVCLILGVLLAAVPPSAQTPASSSPATPTASAAAPQDALGRDTPRGTVMGFINAARDNRNEVAPLYLNTKLRGPAAADLAHQLFVVLDTRLPPRLNELSDRPAGSVANPLKPDQEVIGSVATANGPLPIVLERTAIGSTAPMWLFSRQTLEAIPDAFAEIDLISIDRHLPGFLTKPKIAGVRLFEWLALCLIVPVTYRASGWIGRLVRPPLVWWRRLRGSRAALPADLVPGSIRLLILAVAIRWLLGGVELPLLERQFWTSIAVMLAIAAIAWTVLMLSAAVERSVCRRFPGATLGEVAAIIRLMRRAADTLIIAAAVLVTLNYFGFDPTAALAGFGIGGIAIALAAQKTLENVVGGLSIIFDKAVRVGDFLKLGDIFGTVDYIGLRSTRIRTLDRTIVSVPNGQIANVNIETLSVRDKFWFHHFVALRLETTSAQMRTVINGIRQYLGAHPMIDGHDTIRVRFIRLGQSSLDIEVFAYILASDWETFLETQQELLLDIMEMVERAGATIALPSQTLQLFDARRALTDRGMATLARQAG